MSKCDDIDKCKFLEDITNSMPSLAETVMDKFCNTGGMGCARKMVSTALERNVDKRHISEDEAAFRKKVIEEGRAH